VAKPIQWSLDGQYSSPPRSEATDGKSETMVSFYWQSSRKKERQKRAKVYKYVYQIHTPGAFCSSQNEGVSPSDTAYKK
jgi:hypothetical protein